MFQKCLSFFKSVEKRFGLETDVKWSNVIYLSLHHMYGFYWCWLHAFPAKPCTIVFYLVMGVINGIGITCGAHRYFTHKSYQANKTLRMFLLTCFLTCGQNSLYNWVRDHRVHHKCTDTRADPHDATRGFFYSHIGWLMMRKSEHTKREGKTIDMSDIEADYIIMLQEKYFAVLKLMFCFVIPTAINIWVLGERWQCAVGWQCVIRYLHAMHSEMTVNSLAHLYGDKPFNKNIMPRENKLVSFLAIGEGWHNYHHTFPFDYKAAEYFDKLNLSGTLIRWWARRGWAYDLKEASPLMIDSVLNKSGDGTHPRYFSSNLEKNNLSECNSNLFN